MPFLEHRRSRTTRAASLNAATLAAMATLLFVGSNSARAAEIVAFDMETSGTAMTGTVAVRDIGFEFVPTTDITVTSLLVWDHNGNDFGLLDADVAIWRVSSPGAPVVSGAIHAAGSPVVSTLLPGIHRWRAVDVPDTVLTAGTVYRIAGDGFGGSQDYFRPNVVPVLNGITVTGYYVGPWDYAPLPGQYAGVDFPNELVVGTAATFAPWGAVSFTIAVPEPSTVGIAAVGAVGLLRRSRRAFH